MIIQIPGSGRSASLRVAMLVAAIASLAACSAESATTLMPLPEEQSAPTTVPAPTSALPLEPTPEPTLAPLSVNGAELAFGATVPVVWPASRTADASVWNVRVAAPSDVTAQLPTSLPWYEPPPDGYLFAAFDVQLTLAQAGAGQPLRPYQQVTWEIVGGNSRAVFDSATVLPLGCGPPANGSQVDAVFVGGSLFTSICIPIPLSDLTHPDTRVALNLGTERVYFASSGEVPLPAAVDSSSKAASAPADHRFGETVPVVWSVFGEWDGSVWDTRVSELREVPGPFAAEDQDGTRRQPGPVYVEFDVEMTLLEADSEPLSPGFIVVWEIFGAASNRVYSTSGLAGCDAASFGEEMQEVFVGGTVSYRLCVLIAADDFADPATRVSMNFGGGSVSFGN